MNSNEIIEIKASKIVSFLYIILSLFLGFLGFFGFLKDTSEYSDNTLLGSLFIVFAVILLLKFLGMFFSKDNEIVINEDGISYYKYPRVKGFLAWKDVDYIEEKRRKNYKFVSLYIKKDKIKKESIIQSIIDFLAGNRYSLNIISIFIKGYNHKEILKILEEFFEKYGKK